MGQKPPLFKGQAFRLASIAIGLVVGLGAVLMVQAISSDNPLPVRYLIGAGVAGILIAVFAAVIGLVVGRRVFGQRLEIALRTAGQTKWQHGRVEASPGHLRFRRYKWQLRFASGDPVDYSVRGVGHDTGQRPSKKQIWSVNPSLHVIEVETDRGTLQLGVQAHQVDNLRGQLQPVGIEH